VPDAARDLAAQRSRAMLDVSYAGSPLVAEHAPGGPTGGPAVGSRFPDRAKLSGILHHLIVFGAAPADGLRARWQGLVEVVDGRRAGFDPARAGVADGGAVLVRPDGMIGFRAIPADESGIAALDAHLSSYLVPSNVSASASVFSASPVVARG